MGAISSPHLASACLRIAMRLLCACALTACHGASTTPVAAAMFKAAGVIDSRWQCEGLDLEARFSADKVALSFSGQHLELPQALAASGARYADAIGNEFWNKGRESRLTLADGRVLQCEEKARVPPRAG